jgi:hypothetical protein
VTLPKRSGPPTSEVARLTRQVLGHWLVFPLALFLLAGCTTPADRVRINQAQVIGTHNSYHLRGPESLHKLIANYAPGLAQELDYNHRPLAELLT